MNTIVLLKLAAFSYFGIIAAALVMPRIVGLEEHLRPLPDFIRKLFWVYYMFLGLCLVGFGTGTFVFAKDLASGSLLGRALCGFLGLFWAARRLRPVAMKFPSVASALLSRYVWIAVAWSVVTFRRSTMSDALAQLGLGLGHVVKTGVYLADMAQWEAVARAHREAFGEVRPACTWVECGKMINPEMLVEIDAVAVE